MIVVIGSPLVASGTGPERAEGPAPRIARAASRAGAAVELVGKVGDDPDGDTALLALAQGGIGHTAVLRDAAHRTPRAPEAPGDLDDLAPAGAALAADSDDGAPALDAGVPQQLPLDEADLQLALRYLVDYRVVVVAEPLSEAAGRVVAEAVAFASARPVVVVEPGAAPPAALAGAIVLEGPETDEGPFADLVGRLAAALDRGEAPTGALDDAISAIGWQPVEA
jgi:hypothetical protein